MRVGDRDIRSVWWDDEHERLSLIDQRRLPHALAEVHAETVDETAHLIRDMAVRGAPAIGATAAYGMVLGRDDANQAAATLRAARPTARDLFTAVDHMLEHGCRLEVAHAYVDDVVERCRLIGEHGRNLLEDLAVEKGRLNVLTHCHAGALATVDHGTALAPLHAIRAAPLDSGIEPHVFVSETRPRIQGAITAWELGAAGIGHTVVADNAAAHLIAQGEVDIVITGADRIVANGDVANKIGTYTRALAAAAHDVPFYVAAPATTFDLSTETGRGITIEERDPAEVLSYAGAAPYPPDTNARNPAFDVTPARLVTGFIIDLGIVPIASWPGRREQILNPSRRGH